MPVQRPVAPKAIARGTAIALAGHVTSLARPLALAAFARLYGPSALGAFMLIWALAELAARVAVLGLDRGLQRWSASGRDLAVAAALVIAFVASVVGAGVLAAVLPRFVPIEAGALLQARIAVVVTVPLLAVGAVALRAARGELQIGMYVLSRNVVEPVVLLIAGLAISRVAVSSTALLAAWEIAVIGGALIAGWAVVRAVGGAALVRALGRPRAWPARELFSSSIPLGLADLFQLAQGKLDLLAVALVTQSAPAIAAYAIAAEVASALSQVRQGFEQVITPIAAEQRGRRTELVETLTFGVRWSAMIGLPIAVVLVAFPRPLLELFGGDATAAAVLVMLALGRALDVTLGAASAMLLAIGRQRLVLLDAAIGVAIAILGQLALAGYGELGVAIASGLGLVSAHLLALYWLAKLEHVRPRWPELAGLVPFGLAIGLPLVGSRFEVGAAQLIGLAVASAAGLLGYHTLATGARTRRLALADR